MQPFALTPPWQQRSPKKMNENLLPMTSIPPCLYTRPTKSDLIGTWWATAGWMSMLVLGAGATFFVFDFQFPSQQGLAEFMFQTGLLSASNESLLPWRTMMAENMPISETGTCNSAVQQEIQLPKIYNFVESKRVRIYTYFDPPPLGQFELIKTELAIVRLWKRSFFRHGWMPVLISVSEATAVPGFQELRAKLSLLPTVNTAHYELSCYLRWIAMAGVGGGYMSDYDIINYGVPPPSDPLTNQIMGYAPHWPMFTSGNARAYLDMAKTFAAHNVSDVGTYNGLPHTSDMVLSQKVYAHKFKISNVSVAGMFHYKHDVLHELFGEDSKYTRIEQIMRSTCYHAVLRISPVKIIVIPVTETTQAIASTISAAFDDCLQLTLKDGGTPAEVVIESEQPTTIFLSPPSIVAALLEHHETFLKLTNSEIGFHEYLEYLQSLNDTDQLPIQMIANVTSPMRDKLLYDPLIKGIIQNQKIDDLRTALSHDGVFSGFLHRPRETLELLEYEAGFLLDTATKERLVNTWTLAWTHISLLLRGVNNDIKFWMEDHFSDDECLLHLMQKQFQARVAYLQRIQELEREPYSIESQ